MVESRQSAFKGGVAKVDVQLLLDVAVFLDEL
jgi:hypothetical protein